MKTIILLFIVIVAVVDYTNGQCGCPKQLRKLLKRSLTSVKMGDMLLDATDIAIINGFKNHYANSKKWPNNVVLYSFAGNFPRDKMGAVKESLGELQNDLKGCIKFQESKNGHYIEVNSKREGCYSLLGYTGGPNQPLNLENPGCMYSKGTIKHEFIHALGFMHTHMRKDRDQHIKINWARILSSQCSQFVKCDGCEPDGPYETESVMHYNSEGFACDPNEKVVLKMNGGAIGYNHATTQNDLNMIRNFYNCENAKNVVEQMNDFNLAGQLLKIAPVVEEGGLNEFGENQGVSMTAADRLGLMAKLAVGTGLQVVPKANSVQAPIINSQCFVLSNMFDVKDAHDDKFCKEVQDDVVGECNQFGGVYHVHIDRKSPRGEIYVKCPSIYVANKCVSTLHGRSFDGRLITANYIPLEHYHKMFPESVSVKKLVRVED